LAKDAKSDALLGGSCAKVASNHFATSTACGGLEVDFHARAGCLQLRLGLVFDRFSQFRDQYVGLNEHDDAIKETLPLIQIYATGHELGHAIEDFLSTRGEYETFPLTPFMRDAIGRCYHNIDPDENFGAYKASPSEQYADILGHFILVSLINRITEDYEIDPDTGKEVADVLTNSLEVINNTMKRTYMTDSNIETARDANLMHLTAS
ncbi:MAG: hypothetical protein AAF244_01115, partial [Pseudomonadota bacterium]